MIQKTCPNCRATYNDETLNFCLECGAPLNAKAGNSFSANDETPTIVGLPPARPVARKTNFLPYIIGLVLGVLVFGILGAAAVGIYLSGQNTNRVENNKPTISPTPKKETPTPKSSPSPSPSPTKDDWNKNSAPPSPSPSPSVFSSNKSNNDDDFRITTSASSVRKPDAGNFYDAAKAFDGKMETAWCEGVKGAGIGESLRFNFSREVQLNAVTINGGYFKSREAWQKNNRLSQAKLEFSDGTTQTVNFPDTMDSKSVTFDDVQTSSVKITILGIYRGSSDSEDTLISEVYFNLR